MFQFESAKYNHSKTHAMHMAYDNNTYIITVMINDTKVRLQHIYKFYIRWI